MKAAGPVGTNGREQIPVIQSNKRIFHLTTVPGKEDGATARSVADTEHISLLECGATRGGGEWIVVRLVAV